MCLSIDTVMQIENLVFDTVSQMKSVTVIQMNLYVFDTDEKWQVYYR